MSVQYETHCLVCFLAFVLWKSLEMWQSRAGLGNSPRIILEELKRIQSQDVVLPTAAHRQIRLRCVTQPDPAQAILLYRLGITLPKRMLLAEQHLPVLEHTRELRNMATVLFSIFCIGQIGFWD
jgi:hypothetical protein